MTILRAATQETKWPQRESNPGPPHEESLALPQDKARDELIVTIVRRGECCTLIKIEQKKGIKRFGERKTGRDRGTERRTYIIINTNTHTHLQKLGANYKFGRPMSKQSTQTV